MDKILLIKTGAAGDVVRTTILLTALKGRITWVVDNSYAGLLPVNHPNLERVIALEHAWEQLQQEHFDCIVSLEEDMACAQLAMRLHSNRLIGIYPENEQVTYTPECADWLDMSLISKLGRTAANALKQKNTATFQELLLQMFNLPFNGEPYCIYQNTAIQPDKQVVGIETRVGDRWPNKGWSGYPALVEQLQQQGYTCKVLTQRASITQYLDDIAGCGYLISGDTLAMHVAMAYQIPSIAIFNCTSPTEIYHYGTLQKAVSPLLSQAFYKTSFSQEVVDSISVEEVLGLLKPTFVNRHV
jgi:heptosyltransferase II